MIDENLILYTDGSFREGKAGWGFHGYFYSPEPMKSKANTKMQPTTEGYKDVAALETCTVSKYVDGFGSILKNPTNNVAELKATIEAFKYANNKKVTNLKLFLDSDYVRLGLLEHVAKWIKADWKNSKREPVKNKNLWVELFELKTEWDKAGKVLELINVMGHSGDFGNDKADINALRGIQAETDSFFETDSIEINRIKKIEINPLILESRLLFSTSDKSDDLHYYSYNLGRLHSLGIKQKDSAKQKLAKADLLIGRRISEATFSVFKATEPEEYLDFLKTLHTEGLKSNDPELAIVNLNNACNARQRQQIESLGISGLIIHDDIKAISTPEMALISRTLYPPRLAYDAIMTFNNLEYQLTDYLAGNLGDKSIVIDVLDMFYVNTSKTEEKVYSLLKNITNATLSVDVKVNIKGNDNLIKLVPTIDIPSRNQLNKLSKNIQEVVIVINMTGPSSYSYSTIFKTREGSAIYSSPYVQLITKN